MSENPPVHAWALGGLWCGVDKSYDLVWTNVWIHVTCLDCLKARDTYIARESERGKPNV